MFCSRLGWCKKDDKWGYIDYSGNIYIPTIFDEVQNHYEYKANVKLNKMIIVLEEFGEWGILNQIILSINTQLLIISLLFL